MTCFTCNSRGGWYKKCDWCGGTGEVLEHICFVINWYQLNVADLRGWSPEAMVCYEVKNGKHKGVWEDVHPN